MTQWNITRSKLQGTLVVPPSKSHTIRALVVAACAQGRSVLRGALCTGDGRSALRAAAALGATVRDGEGNAVSLETETETVTQKGLREGALVISGFGGAPTGGQTNIYMGNSGTGTRLFAALAACAPRRRVFDGDRSLRSRPFRPLLDALVPLGARYDILPEATGDLPFAVTGPLTGGTTVVDGTSSQFLSALLMCAPLVKQDILVDVVNLHERPYVELTLWWLDRMGIRYEVTNGFSRFTVFGDQHYAPVDMRIPGDFSSATFGAVGAAVTGGEVTLRNLDFSDPQGDRIIFTFLEKMGAVVRRRGDSVTVCCPDGLDGVELDLNSCPDALPAFAVAGCAARGVTRLVNVRQARIKETDRIAVMTDRLRALGAAVEEREDGMVITGSRLSGTVVDGCDDHRIVMACALAGMIAEGTTGVTTAGAAAVTYPGFVDDFRACGAAMTVVDGKPA